MKTGLKVFLACALGATVGTYVALDVIPILWWVGLVVGGLVGYLSYEWKHVANSAPKAWATAAEICYEEGHGISILLKACGMMLGFALNVSISIAVILFWIDSQAIGWHRTMAAHFEKPKIFLLYLLLGGSLSWIVGGFIHGIKSACKDRSEWRIDEILWDDFHLAGIPVIFWIWSVPAGIIRSTVWCVKHTPQGLRKLCTVIAMLARFCKTMFILMHSEMRLLCLVDAVLGVVIGHHFGSVLIGCLAGGLSGVFSFEILSIRIFKLVPQSSSIFSQ